MMKKNDKIHIPISSEDKKKLQKRADSVGISLASYCLFILLSAKPKMPED